jgi:hypothetical protein
VESAAPELVCPAGSLPTLKTAVDQGADAVYLGFRDATNARNFAGLNFDEDSARAGIRYAHARGAAVLLELCVAAGGTITGEHGVGIEKLTQMCMQFTPGELAVFRAVKAAFDEARLLNPGKAVPAPRRCSEYRLARGSE